MMRCEHMLPRFAPAYVLVQMRNTNGECKTTTAPQKRARQKEHGKRKARLVCMAYAVVTWLNTASICRFCDAPISNSSAGTRMEASAPLTSVRHRSFDSLIGIVMMIPVCGNGTRVHGCGNEPMRMNGGA